MNEKEKAFLLMGISFLTIGLLVFLPTCFIAFVFPFILVIGLPISVVFMGVGAGFMIAFFSKRKKESTIRENGRKYTGKITGYSEDTSVVVNGHFLMNIKVHYFDDQGVERETIVPTKFTPGTNDFPIGATIDFVEYENKYSWIPGSVRKEQIEGEEELMDQKPMDPTKINLAAVSCRTCGASFTAAKGYVATCPYCGGRIDN